MPDDGRENGRTGRGIPRATFPERISSLGAPESTVHMCVGLRIFGFDLHATLTYQRTFYICRAMPPSLRRRELPRGMLVGAQAIESGVSLAQSFSASSLFMLLGSVSQSLVPGKSVAARRVTFPPCLVPQAVQRRARLRASDPEGLPSVLSPVDITDLTLSCEAGPGNGCPVGVRCCLAQVKNQVAPCLCTAGYLRDFPR